MRVPPTIIVSTQVKEKLELIASRPKSSLRESTRARIVLACAEGLSNQEVSKQLSVTVQTVGKWRRRFSLDGLGGLVDAPRSGAPRTISDKKVEEVLTKTLEGPPPNRTHYSSSYFG